LAASGEHRNESSGSIKRGNFLTMQGTIRLSKRACSMAFVSNDRRAINSYFIENGSFEMGVSLKE
jgi:hypothetical protein